MAMAVLLAGCGGSAANTGGAKPPERDHDGVGDDKKTVVAPEIRSKEANDSFVAAESAFAAAGNDCAQLCKALNSMTKATDRLCELAKENGDGKRCEDAKTRLDAARAKVKSTCGSCS